MLSRQLELYGGRIRDRSTTNLRKNVETEIIRLFGKAANDLTRELRHLLEHCERLIEYQRTSDRELKRVASNNELCRRFMEIPGVGPMCALTFYAVVSDPHRFRCSADIGSYLGLTPKIEQSGLTRRAGRISKMGNSAARALLVGASIRFMRSGGESTLRSWTLSVESRRGRRKSRIALARKLATLMVAIWKSGEHYQPRVGTEQTEDKLVWNQVNATSPALAHS
jgi:transposase